LRARGGLTFWKPLFCTFLCNENIMNGIYDK
jgi:hypothetical protein